MSIQNGLRRLKLTTVGPLPRFLIMFIGVIVAPLILFVIGGYNSNILGLGGSAWYFLGFALLLLISIGGGVLMFRGKFNPSKMSLYQTEIPLEAAEASAKTHHRDLP
jgi:hypothetical protein